MHCFCLFCFVHLFLGRVSLCACALFTDRESGAFGWSCGWGDEWMRFSSEGKVKVQHQGTADGVEHECTGFTRRHRSKPASQRSFPPTRTFAILLLQPGQFPLHGCMRGRVCMCVFVFIFLSIVHSSQRFNHLFPDVQEGAKNGINAANSNVLCLWNVIKTGKRATG